MTTQTAADVVNIASALEDMAARQPHALAVVFPQGRDAQGRVSYTHLTYRQLARETDRIARGLGTAGIGRGCRTVLMVRPSLDFFALTFALFKAGIVPVLIDPGIGLKHLKACIAEAEPEAFIGITPAHVARVALGWGRGTIKTLVTVGRRLFWGGTTLAQVKRAGGDAPYAMAPTRADETAAILFTSGSTGVPKGAVYQHRHFLAQVAMIRDAYGIQPGEIDLPTFPLFALFDPALGMTTIVPDMDPTRPARVDPRKIVEAIEDFGVTNMFGSPALIDRVSRYGQAHGIKLPTLRRAISAGAPVPAATLERFTAMLSPGVQVFTPYGATESLPVCSIGSGEILGETRARTEKGAGVCVGRPAAGMEVRVIGITDEPITRWEELLALPPGQTGEIVVKGPVVTAEYYNRPLSTALAKIYEPGGVRHRMGDVGYFDAQGRLWFCGRKSHRVVTGGGTLFTIPCEAVFNTHPAVYRTALVGVDHDGRTEPVLCVELERGAGGADREALRWELLALGATQPHTRGIQHILFHDAFPVDIRHNAKIFREQLAAWARGRLE